MNDALLALIVKLMIGESVLAILGLLLICACAVVVWLDWR